MNDLAESFFISVLNANVSLHVAELGTALGLLVTCTPTAAEARTTAETHCGCVRHLRSCSSCILIRFAPPCSSLSLLPLILLFSLMWVFLVCP